MSNTVHNSQVEGKNVSMLLIKLEVAGVSTFNPCGIFSASAELHHYKDPSKNGRRKVQDYRLHTGSYLLHLYGMYVRFAAESI